MDSLCSHDFTLCKKQAFYKHFALKIDGKEDDPVIRLPVGANGLFSGASC